MNKRTFDVIVRDLFSLHVHVPIFEIQAVSAAECDDYLLLLLVVCYKSEQIVDILDRVYDISFSYALDTGAWLPAIPFFQVFIFAIRGGRIHHTFVSNIFVIVCIDRGTKYTQKSGIH